MCHRPALPATISGTIDNFIHALIVSKQDSLVFCSQRPNSPSSVSFVWTCRLREQCQVRVSMVLQRLQSAIAENSGLLLLRLGEVHSGVMGSPANRR